MPQLLSPSRRRALAGALLLVAALVVAGRWAVRAETPAGPAAVETLRAVPPGAAAAAAEPELVVHVVGAVRRAGLYRLPEGSRIADAVERAGGATARADLAAVNLAAPVADGLQVIVPARGAGPAGGPAGAAAPAGPVHLNSATVEQLDALPGVGPVTAQKIVDYREANGAFRSVDELDAVPGIGPAKLEELRPAVAP